jgi:ParB-like chromosome segregation protein Spo0J
MSMVSNQIQTALKLAPEAPPDLEMRRIHPTLLIVKEQPKPSKALRDSVAAWGVLQSVLVHKEGAPLAVVDGNRRVLAALDAGPDIVEDVPCLVTSDFAYLKHVAAMMLNNTRERNILAESESIDALLNDGHDVKSIARATGVSVATIQKRMKLRNLNPAVRSLLDDGRIASGVAEQIAKLSKSEQNRLVKATETLDRGGRSAITEDDVKAVRRAESQHAAQSLDPSLFDDPPPAQNQSELSDTATSFYVSAMIDAGKTQAEVIAAIKKHWKRHAGAKRTG